MRIRSSIAMIAALGAALFAPITGCQNQKIASAPPADAAMLKTIRQETARQDPEAIVGMVIAVEPRGYSFAAVGDVPSREFHEGDVIEFMDTNRQILTNGIVRRVTDDAVHVEWMKPPVTGRAPRVGDLAIRYRQPIPSTPEPSATPTPVAPAPAAEPQVTAPEPVPATAPATNPS